MSQVGYARVSTLEGRQVLDLDRLGRQAADLITLIDELEREGWASAP